MKIFKYYVIMFLELFSKNKLEKSAGLLLFSMKLINSIQMHSHIIELYAFIL